MSPAGRPGQRRRLAVPAAAPAAPGLALLLVLLATTPVAARAALPLTLERPAGGRQVELSAGAPALHLVFFATWCPECMDELDRLAEVEARWSGRGYRLVLIAVPTRQSAERLNAFERERLPPGELLFDGEGRAAKAFSAERLPLHVVLDGEGRELARAGQLGPDVEAALERALARRGGR